MTYDHWKTTEPDDGAEKLDQQEDERELLYASIRHLRASRDELLAAAKIALQYAEKTEAINILQAAIAAAEEQ